MKLLAASERMTRGSGGRGGWDEVRRRRMRSAALNNMGCLHKRYYSRFPPPASPFFSVADPSHILFFVGCTLLDSFLPVDIRGKRSG
jgi:hypothetical protein